ncbi:MAG: peptidylprolyl isomerase [Bryobacteraceae bacterium]|nr:MAG: peptidylprolyl isomerase [Bryobacteraceae bacterium]
MFDLFRSRERTVRYLLGALLLLVAASMVITLVPGYGTGWASGPDPTLLAEVGDHRITVQEVRRVIQREMKGNMPEGMASVYVPTVVQQLVGLRASALYAEQLGFRVTDEEMARTLRQLIPQLWPGGTFAGKEAYSQFVAQQNMTIPEFEASLRSQILLTRLETLSLEGTIVTPQEVEEEFRRRNEAVKVQTLAVSPANVRHLVKLSDDELAAYFEKNKAAYRVPEKRSFLIFALDEDGVGATVQVSEDQLRQMYDQQLERFRVPERAHVRHILIKTVDRPASEVPSLQKKAEELLAKLKGGADFAELAKKNSEDPGSAEKGGDLGWITRGQTVPEFEKAAFSLNLKELSGLIKTEYGFHIIQVLEREQARVRPFSEVRSELASEAKRAQVYDKMQRVADQIRVALVRSREEAEKIARENGVSVVRSENVGPGDPVQEIGVNEQFNGAVQGLPVNGVTPVVQVSPSKLVVAQVTAVTPARQAELKEVINQVRAAATAARAGELSQKISSELEARVKAGVKDLAQLAKEFGLEVKTSDFVTRNMSVEGIGPAELIEDAFRAEPGAFLGPIKASGVTVCVKVLEKRPADMTQLAAQRSSILEELKSQRARLRSELLRAGIVEELTRRKKVKIYEENVKRLVAAYSS